jgi:glycosyltransferase involved in cell wall biosynthesis
LEKGCPTNEGVFKVKIGVIVPVRNSIQFIDECLTSITNQTYGNVSAYVADDLSDDGTYEWLLERPEKYGKLKRNSTRLGWPGNTNSAAKLALEDGCDAIYLAAADDYLHLSCIKILVTYMEELDLDWVVTNAQQVGNGIDVQACQPNPILADFKSWPPLIDKALFRREVWETVGGFSDDVTVPGSWGAAEDWELWIKIFKAGFTNYRVLQELFYYYRMHDAQLWPYRAAIHKQTIELIKRKHPDVWELPGGWDHIVGFDGRYVE